MAVTQTKRDVQKLPGNLSLAEGKSEKRPYIKLIFEEGGVIDVETSGVDALPNRGLVAAEKAMRRAIRLKRKQIVRKRNEMEFAAQKQEQAEEPPEKEAPPAEKPKATGTKR